MYRSGTPRHSGNTVERVRQTAAANFLLLAMMEVVRDWTRADAADLAEAAEHTEAVCSTLDLTIDVPASEDALNQAYKVIGEVRQKLDRLNRLAPVQSRDSASVSAVTEGLRRLRVANEALMTVLDTGAPPGVQGPAP